MNDGIEINLVCCTMVIQNECQQPKLRQRDIALSYAMALKSEAQGADQPDWRAINEAVRARWPKGLDRVKQLAWDIAEGKRNSQGALIQNVKG